MVSSAHASPIFDHFLSNYRATLVFMAYSRFSFLLISCLLVCSAFTAQSQNQSNRTTNVIDSCWRSKPYWGSKRKALTDCAVGFGGNAQGGKNGRIYVVSNPYDDPANPKPGTLRYGVIQKNPLWIIFARDMVISLKSRILVSSYTTIDGRGFKVEIADGPCILVNQASHVIIHGINVRDCKAERPGLGDGITISGSSHLWIDHCSLSNCVDGLIDVVRGSTDVTISNNYFTNQDKVMLLGNDDLNDEDENMRVTVVLNHFGPGLVQRMPRVRRGYAHVANNRYEKWENYAIGGSGNPTIFSEGNYYNAPEIPLAKEVTKRHTGEQWRTWTWKSSRDVFRNGAFFVESGSGSYLPKYSPSQAFTVADGNAVPALASSAGPIRTA